MRSGLGRAKSLRKIVRKKENFFTHGKRRGTPLLGKSSLGVGEAVAGGERQKNEPLGGAHGWCGVEVGLFLFGGFGGGRGCGVGLG